VLVSLCLGAAHGAEGVGCVMNVHVPGTCQRPQCPKTIPQALASEQLCLDHFMDEAFQRTNLALDRCRHGLSVEPKSLEWLLADALAIVRNLEEGAADPNPEQRDRMLELLLILANLHEYVAHHSVRLERLA
jgi:hypothetical protein